MIDDSELLQNSLVAHALAARHTAMQLLAPEWVAKASITTPSSCPSSVSRFLRSS